MTQWPLALAVRRTSPLRLRGGGLLVVAGLLAVVGCSRHGKSAPVGGSPVPPSQTKLQRAVEIGPVEKRPLEVFVETVGYLEAEGQTDIAAGVSGLVDAVLCREGQWVDRNTVLFKIDQRRYEAQLAMAEATMREYEANALAAEAAVKEKEAALDLAIKTRSLDEARYEFALKSKTGIAREELAEREAAVRQGAARVEAARSAVEVAQANLSAARKKVEAARAQRDLAERNMSLSIVRAPYPGQINQRRVTTPGTYVEDKSVLATMADLRRLRLVGWVPEKAAPVVRDMLVSDQRLRGACLAGVLLSDATGYLTLAASVLHARGDVRVPSRAILEFRLLPYPDRLFKGRIFYLSTVANPETHMFECKAEVDASDEVELRPGYMARIRAPIRGNPNALVVPEEAVRPSEHGSICFVPEARKNKEGKEEWVARRRRVDLGYRSGLGRSEADRGDLKAGLVEVLDGLKPGEWIVTRGSEALEDGTLLAIPPAQLEQLKRQRGGAE